MLTGEIIYLLVTHPEPLQKLIAEIRGTFLVSCGLTMEAVRSCPTATSAFKKH